MALQLLARVDSHVLLYFKVSRRYRAKVPGTLFARAFASGNPLKVDSIE